MKIFFRGVMEIIIQCKINFVLRFIYPQKKKYRKVKSIIPKGVELGDGGRIEEKVIFYHTFKKIGRHVVIGSNSYIGFCSSIGNFSGLGRDVLLGIDSHPMHFLSTNALFYSPRHGFIEEKMHDELDRGLTEVGCDVMIGTRAMILSGIKIGHGAIIAAGSLVNKHVPPYAIVRGIPAKIVAYRFDDETIKKLLESKWWDLSDEVLQQHVADMKDPNVFLEALKKKKE